jgi:hypothetical protein
MDPDLFITIVFCSLVFGLAAGAGAVFVRTALRGNADPDESESVPIDSHTSSPMTDRADGAPSPSTSTVATPVVRRRENPSLTEQGGGAQWHP